MGSQESPVWLPTAGRPPLFWTLVGLGVMYAAFLPVAFIIIGGAPYLIRVLFSTANPGLAAALVGTEIATPLAFVVVALSQVPNRIGIGPTGVHVHSRLRERIVFWADLRPSQRPPVQRWGWLSARRFGGPGGRAPPVRDFPVSREQAAAILGHPNAPRNLFPPESWEWIGHPDPNARPAPSS